ncbi:MAG: tripartite tricarboxylate transporter substrate binding protein [Betaproteobacteria bacterium]|nr:tripartite tricarboxylate transporter substrate binding protein [Betaproteobacteria bacterium]
MKHLMTALLLAVVLGAFATAAPAQTYPTKPVRVIAPFPAGGTSDMVARILGAKLTEAWGQQIVVENRAGVAGSLGSAALAKSPPDGYSLLVGNTGPVAINVSMYKNVGYDPVKDFAPITLAVGGPQIVVVHPSVPARTFKEFMALVKSHKDRLNYGSSGPGSVSHLSAEMFKKLTKLDMVHIPYKGSALITPALIGGHVDVVFSDLPVMLPHVKAGKVRALAVTGDKPTPLVPGVPTVAESGVPGLVFISWWGVLAPTGTPEPIISRLNAEIGRILALNDVKERFAGLGVDTIPSTPQAFASFIKTEVEKYAALIKDVGIKAD